MRRKCRICGYRFTSDDEVICPECFTSREEDMTCKSFSDDDHSHNNNVYEERKRFDNTTYSVNDTFNEGGNTFLENERRVEKNDAFAKQAQRQASEGFTQSAPTQNTTTQNNTYTRPQAAQTFTSYSTTTNKMPYTYRPLNQNTYNKKKNNNPVALVIVIIILISAFVGFIENMSTSYDSDDTYDYTYDNTTTTEPYEEIDYYKFQENNDIKSITGAYGSFIINQTGFYGSPSYTDELTDKEKKDITYGKDKFDVWYYTTVYYSFEEVTANNISFQSAKCVAYDVDGNAIASSTAMNDLPYIFNYDTQQLIEIMVPAGADFCTITLTIESDDGVNTYPFDLTF